MAQIFAGLISGTSADGVDAALIETEAEAVRVLHALTHPLPPGLGIEMVRIAESPDAVSLDRVLEIDVQLGDVLADAVEDLLRSAGVPAERVTAVGSHGQTILHRADGPNPGTLQIGDATRLACRTGLTVVSDFRRADMARGGQGAPLAPTFHAAVFAAPDETRAVLNLGGIANLTRLSPGDPVTGFDTGPANALMDIWIRSRLGQDFDRDGTWAASGTIDEGLLARLLEDPYFGSPPPKSTGRDRFSLEWIEARLRGEERAEDVQATLLELTACSVVRAMQDHIPDAERVLVCGGGVHNQVLIDALRRELGSTPVESTEQYGIDPDFVEAATFAWLAFRRLQGLPGALASVTGADRDSICGAVHQPTP